MNNELIVKLQEASPFVPVSKEEGDVRAANRPPKVLGPGSPDFPLQTTLASMTVYLGQSEIMESLMNGTPFYAKGIMDMSIKELVYEISMWAPAVHSNVSAAENLNKKAFALEMIKTYMGDIYTDIEGI